MLCSGRSLAVVPHSTRVLRHVVNRNLAPQVLSTRHTSTEVPPTGPSSGAAVEIINIQDEDDFTKRVVESKLPVIVDFHAS
jgi:hypothetical protein